MNGLIALWKGDVTYISNTIGSFTYQYYVPTIPNWYVCDGSQIDADFTTPNIVGYVPVGLSPTDSINTIGDTSGNVSISEDIPISNHTHDITITTSSIISNVDVSMTLIGGDGLLIETNETGINVVPQLHKHYISNELTGTTSLSMDLTIDSGGNTYRFNYVSQYYIIYYASLTFTSYIFKGMIYYWIGNITTTVPYQPIDSNGTTLTSWYICCEENENYNSKSIPNINNNIIIISNSGYSTVNSLSTSIRDPIDIETHDHNISSSTTSISTLGTDSNTYSPNYNISLNNAGIDSMYNTSSATLYETMLTKKHSHQLDYTTYTFDQTVTTSDLSDNIFNYINLYSIIYLPD